MNECCTIAENVEYCRELNGWICNRCESYVRYADLPSTHPDSFETRHGSGTKVVDGEAMNECCKGVNSFDESSLRRCPGPAMEEIPQGFVRPYHDALNSAMVLLLDMEEKLAQCGVERKWLDPKFDAATALAVGYRMGWPVDPRIEDRVKAAEDSDMPMSEEEAGKRMGL